MQSSLAALRPALPILIGASVMLTLSMGLRQSFGLFMQPMTRDISISVSDFTLALAVQNLVWGFVQPLAGALLVRWNYRSTMLMGSLIYAVGLALMATAGSLTTVVIGVGILIGFSLAFTTSAVAMAAAARSVSPALRSMVLGIVSAAGSLGALVAAPIGQGLQELYGWRVGVAGFLVLGLLMLPAAWVAGRVDALPPPPRQADDLDDTSAGQAARAALSNPSFVVMALAFFVCGMQLLFITTHLPSYLAICGMDPMLSAQALGMIGGFNVLGSLFFGWAGGRWNKQGLLGLIYLLRSVTLAVYFSSPPTASSTLMFAAAMGFLWFGVAPLMTGAVVEMFGLKWQAMIGGLAFMVHQFGSFLGAYGGGVLYDRLGSYTLAWQLAVGIGITAGVVQMMFAFTRGGTTPTALAAR
jgi:predicted MFS family arabinose efflux permease